MPVRKLHHGKLTVTTGMNILAKIITGMVYLGLMHDVHAGRFVRADNPVTNQYIVIFKEKLAMDGLKDPGYQTRNAGLRDRVRQNFRGQIHKDWIDAVNGVLVTMTQSEATRLANEADVVLVEENSYVQLSATQTAAPWHLDRIDQRNLPLDQLYNYSYAGAGVNVYVIDTGIRATHVEFSKPQVIHIQPGSRQEPISWVTVVVLMIVMDTVPMWLE